MGDIVKLSRKGRFVGWYIRYKDVDGKRKQRATHQPTRELARRMLVEVEARVARGRAGMDEATPAATMTMAQLGERFLAEYHNPRIKDIAEYRSNAAKCWRRLLPCLGSLLAAAMTRRDVERARNALAPNCRPNTLRATFRVLNTVLSWAVRETLLGQNVASRLAMPRAEHALEFLTQDQARTLLAHLEARARLHDDPARWARYIAVALCLLAGLRRGEAFGLRWQDLGDKRLTVARSFGGLPKGGRARHLPLPQELVDLLQEWGPRCPKTPEGVVCPLPYRGVYRAARKHSAQAIDEAYRALGLSPARAWHILRHTFASRFVMAGGNILALQKILGHHDVKMTQVYAHLAPDYLAQEMDRVKY